MPIVARPVSRSQARAMLAHAAQVGVTSRIVFWLASRAEGELFLDGGSIPMIFGICDPWHLLSQATAVWLDLDDENILLARISGISVLGFAKDGSSAAIDGDYQKCLQDFEKNLVIRNVYVDPFTKFISNIDSTIALLAYWRELIDCNRSFVGAAGFAYWKKAAVEPLLWGGAGPVQFLSANITALDAVPRTGALAIWKSRVSQEYLQHAEEQNRDIFEVEDGFIRSAGLGADCVPPLSIVVDKVGVHFDPAGPSELENLLQHGDFSPAILERAERLRRLIIESGVSKYGVGGDALERPGGDRRHILVTGQVEDDRSVLLGGGDVSGNLDLLRRARAQEPDAYIIYKPHPDVEAGHRKGHVPEQQALSFADCIMRDAPISSLLEMVDAIHVLTSLAGFEALIRGKQVTTHGVPFYAGWGLTSDLGTVPVRRSARRDVVEMVAAVLLLYPRYLDPVTALPCPPEVLVQRLVAGIRKENWAIVSLRRLQGSARQKLSKMGITI
jgi:capsular polysaccharide export protein